LPLKSNEDWERKALPQKVSLKMNCLPCFIISFRPGFSRVSRNPKLAGNRLNGFPSKRRRTITWLKPGVNKKRKELTGAALSSRLTRLFFQGVTT
jgi:hypothetical protein